MNTTQAVLHIRRGEAHRVVAHFAYLPAQVVGYFIAYYGLDRSWVEPLLSTADQAVHDAVGRIHFRIDDLPRWMRSSCKRAVQRFLDGESADTPIKPHRPSIESTQSTSRSIEWQDASVRPSGCMTSRKLSCK